MKPQTRILIFLIPVFLLGSGILGWFGLQWWRGHVETQRWIRVFENAEALLKADNPTGALQVLQVQGAPKNQSVFHARWTTLAIEAAARSRDLALLESYAERAPEALRANEGASLWWARILLHQDREAEAWALYESWIERSADASRWRLWAADARLLEGEVEAARTDLEGWTGTGSAEVNRQLRLALIGTTEGGLDLAALDQAYAAGGNRNPDVRATAAVFFEREGANALARREYIAAYLVDSQNPLRAHALADFYFRHNAFAQGLATLRDGYTETGATSLWWDYTFWTRMRQPGNPLPVPSSSPWWRDLAAEFAGLPEKRFTPEILELRQAEVPSVLARRESYFWLETFQNLQSGKETEALALLRHFPRGRSTLAPNLHLTLQTVLAWRVEGYWDRSWALQPGVSAHPFYHTLEDFEPSPPETTDALRDFLKTPWALSAICLAEGWSGAASRLTTEPLPATVAEAPQLAWLPYASVRMRQLREGSASALKDADRFPEDSAVQVFRAELLLAQGEIDRGLALLERERRGRGPAAYRAAYLAALAALDRNELDRAQQILTEQPSLADAVPGKELLAKIARARGETETAAALYAEIRNTSVEALVFFYEQALREEDWNQARSILTDLRLRAPNEPLFQQWENALQSREKALSLSM